MSTASALQTNASNDGDLEAARDRHRQAMPKGNRLGAFLNTAGHVYWLFSSLLLSIAYWMWVWLVSVRRSLRNIDYDSPMDADLVNQLVRESQPSYYELQAQDKRLATECLEHYNAMHPGTEYVLASGKVTQFVATNFSGAWIHVNFVARQRIAWCFSFLYGPQTLFFFELTGSPRHGGLVTCAPLGDELVNEVYRFLGFPLWWTKRRSGIYDHVCQNCACRNPAPRHHPDKTSSCGHEVMEILCKMCYHRSNILHPNPGEFCCGHQRDATFCYFSVYV